MNFSELSRVTTVNRQENIIMIYIILRYCYMHNSFYHYNIK